MGSIGCVTIGGPISIVFLLTKWDWCVLVPLSWTERQTNLWGLFSCALLCRQGKTVQVATFLGNIMANFQAFPALVVVPNSTITNWVREFERWAPKLRVVPFYGEAKARDVIKKFELYHDQKRSGETGAKFHVLVTTYEALLNPKDFTPVFKNQPRWEVRSVHLIIIAITDVLFFT